MNTKLRSSGQEPDEDEQPKYDLAISFLAKDEPTAAALNNGLTAGLKVFFFPRSQEDLAGTDGLESMRKPFLTGSRINVVLYREGWGDTPWTRVEETAIKDACLQRGWSSLFLIALGKSRKPIWVPDTLVRYNLGDYGIEQAIGAIKARVQEAGGTIERPSAMTDAARIHREAQFLQDRERLFRDQRWITDTVLPAVKNLFATIDRIAQEVRTVNGMNFRSGANDGRCVITNNRVSLHVGWRQPYINVVAENAYIIASEFKTQIALPGEPPLLYYREPTSLNQCRFKPALSLTRELCWSEETKPEELLSLEELADKCVRQFLDLLGRANRGEIDFSDDF
jgi:hypothetical protein